MPNHTWSRARVYDRGSGTKVVTPPPLELGLLLLDDFQRRKGARECPICHSPISVATGTCGHCGHLPAGPTSTWPRKHSVNGLIWFSAILIMLIVFGSIAYFYITY